MPDLDFKVTGAGCSASSVTPLLEFGLTITCPDPAQPIQAVLLNTQIQIQSAQRSYSAGEKEKLIEVFGAPESWGQTLRNRLWAHATASVGAFSGSTETVLRVPCTCDLNLWSTKYFEALETGEASLLFLFSGSVFYSGADLRLQVAPISWNKECAFRLPLSEWQNVMQRMYPNTRWLPLRRETFEALSEYKRAHALMTWEATMERLLEARGAAGHSGTEGRYLEEVPA